jgi:uncharacterized membrane protein (DUF4010 family)
VDWNDTLKGIITALGLGLLIGVVRERRHEPGVTKAGTRTHALVAVLGCVTWGLGAAPFVATLLVIGALAVSGYLKTADADPGLTGEVALLVTLVLGGLARQDPSLAAALGVLVAILLQAKKPLQRLSRELISERELEDALMLAAAALVVMPLLPQSAVDPWGVLVPTTLWRIVVLVMAVGMLGHIALRAVGARWGLPIAGFFSGFVSSTATVAGFGRRVREQPELAIPAAAAALLANLASLLLFAAVIGAASPALLKSMVWPLLVGALCLLAVAGLCLRTGGRREGLPDESSASAFKLTHALMIAGIIAVVSLLSAWLRQIFGDAGVLVATVLVALAEIHAAAASISQLNATGGLDPGIARWGVVAVLASSALAKVVLAFVSGSPRYGQIVGAGLLAMVAGAAGTTAVVAG